MEMRTVGLLGAVAGLAGVSSTNVVNAQAPKSADPLHPASYSDLLGPIPNAAELLKADDAIRAETPASTQIVPAYYYYNYYGNVAPYSYDRPYYGGYNPYYGYGYAQPRYYHPHHHHHHHHHHGYWRGY